MDQGKVKRKRTCVSCRRSDDKVSLMRIVRTPDGDVQIDHTGRMPGRGAYVCSLACFEKAMKTKRVEQALKMRFSDDQASELIEGMLDIAGVHAYKE